MSKLKPLTSTDRQRARDHSLETMSHANNDRHAGYRLLSRADLEVKHVLVCQALDHERNVSIALANLIQPRPDEPLPPIDPIKTPDPIDPRTQSVIDAMGEGLTLEQALARVKGNP